MKIDLVSRGANPLPEGYRYRVHVSSILPNGFTIKISIVKRKNRKKRKGLRKLFFRKERVLGWSTILVPLHAGEDVPVPDIVQRLVDEANLLRRVLLSDS